MKRILIGLTILGVMVAIDASVEARIFSNIAMAILAILAAIGLLASPLWFPRVGRMSIPDALRAGGGNQQALKIAAAGVATIVGLVLWFTIGAEWTVIFMTGAFLIAYGLYRAFGDISLPWWVILISGAVLVMVAGYQPTREWVTGIGEDAIEVIGIETEEAKKLRLEAEEAAAEAARRLAEIRTPVRDPETGFLMYHAEYGEVFGAVNATTVPTTIVIQGPFWVKTPFGGYTTCYDAGGAHAVKNDTTNNENLTVKFVPKPGERTVIQFFALSPGEKGCVLPARPA